MWRKLLLGEGVKIHPHSKLKLEKNLWGMLTLQLWDYKFYYLAGMACLFFTHYIQSQLPIIAKDVAELISNNKTFKNYETLVLFSVGIIVFRTLSRLLYFLPARILERDFRIHLVEKIEESAPFRYKNFNAGNLFQTIYTDIEIMRALVGFAVLQLGNVVIAGIVLIPQIFNFNKNLLLPLLPMAVSSVIFTFIVGSMRKFTKDALDAQAEVQNNLIESYNGKETIKNFHAEQPFIKNFDSISYKELFNFYKAGNGIGIAIPLIPLGVGLSLIWGGHIIYAENLGASSLIYFSGMTFLFLEPLAFISWIGVVVVNSSAAWERIKNLVNDLNKKSDEEVFFDNQKEVKLNNLVVNFWNKDIPFSFENNKKYVFVSSTGEGKTEVLKQLSYLYRSKGEFIGHVSQSPYVFDDTLKKNLFLGKKIEEEDKKKAKELLSIFGLLDIEESFEKLLNLPLGENGKRLSGGQIKRMCLVRSLLQGSDILIWDDPFSSVDLILEKEIFKSLEGLGYFDGKTVIFSSHRLSTVKYSDEIIYLGKEVGIIEKGNTKALLETSIELMKFFEKQSSEAQSPKAMESCGE